MNLLLVNKTVMSCILVLQNRRDTEKIQRSTRTELPTVIHVPLKVGCLLCFCYAWLCFVGAHLFRGKRKSRGQTDSRNHYYHKSDSNVDFVGL